jgi:hypothetical protein
MNFSQRCAVFCFGKGISSIADHSETTSSAKTEKSVKEEK